MRAITLIAASTQVITIRPTIDCDSLTLDFNGTDIPMTENAEETAWTGTVASALLPFEALGTLTGSYTMTATVDGGVQVRRKPLSFLIVEDDPGPVLVVGTNTYVTLAEADAYFENRGDAAGWDALTDGQASAALVRAAQHIEMTPLRGCRYATDQTMEFPRALWNMGGVSRRYSEEDERYAAFSTQKGYYGTGIVPQQVEDAQCEEALHAVSATDSGLERGVTSVRIGSFAETYSAAAVANARLGTKSPTALALLRRWIAKSVAIR